MPLRDDTARELVALSGVVLGRDDLSSTLNEICRIAARVIEPCDGATMTSFTERGPTVVGASDEWTATLDELQHLEQEGPCLDAARTGVVFRVRDLAAEPRWPSYTPRAVREGARSVVSVPLNVENKLLGALNLYSRTVDAFDAEDVAISEIIAGHASLATQVAATTFRHRDLAAHLEIAMGSRSVIEQAKGVIMATTHCDADTAFELLTQQSQHENRKLRDIAEDLVARQHRGGESS